MADFVFSFLPAFFSSRKSFVFVVNFYWLLSDEEQLESESFHVSAPVNNMLECLGSLFKYEACFLIQWKWVWTVLVFIAHLIIIWILTISSLLTHGPKSKILCTESVLTFIVTYKIHIPEEFFVPIHILRAFWLYASAWMAATSYSSWVWLMCPGASWK